MSKKRILSVTHAAENFSALNLERAVHWFQPTRSMTRTWSPRMFNVIGIGCS